MKFWILLATLILFPRLANAAITVLYYEVIAYATDVSDFFDRKFYVGLIDPNNPSPYQLNAVAGDAYSKITSKGTQTGGQTIFTLDTNLKRTGTQYWSESHGQSRLEFSVSEPTPYDFSGYINATDVGENESGRVEINAAIYDSTASQYLFGENHSSKNTHDEHLALGGTGGDEGYYLRPGSSLTGTLLPGREYIVSTRNLIYAHDSESGASAVSNFTLKLGTVPEPTSVALCSLFAVLGLIRRRQIV